MLRVAAVLITLTLLPLPPAGAETIGAGIVNTYVQYTLDTEVNTTDSKLHLSFVDDYSDFTVRYCRKFNYPVTPQLLAFSDVTFAGNRHDAYLSQANVGLEYVTPRHSTTFYRRVYEKDVDVEDKYYFTVGARFN